MHLLQVHGMYIMQNTPSCCEQAQQRAVSMWICVCSKCKPNTWSLQDDLS